jgi:putative redox protein
MMSDKAELEWKGELVFRGAADGRELLLDGGRKAGCSPMESLMLSLAGCMAIDVVHILAKMRSEPKSVRVEIEGERAATEPKRFTRLRLRFNIGGEKITPAEVERALSLSREKYCSVYHSLRSDIEVDTSYIIHP